MAGIDGILGYPLLANAIVDVDLANNTIAILDPVNSMSRSARVLSHFRSTLPRASPVSMSRLPTTGARIQYLTAATTFWLFSQTTFNKVRS